MCSIETGEKTANNLAENSKTNDIANLHTKFLIRAMKLQKITKRNNSVLKNQSKNIDPIAQKLEEREDLSAPEKALLFSMGKQDKNKTE